MPSSFKDLTTGAINAHLANTSNPHATTRSQVGLANTPNTDTSNSNNITVPTTPVNISPANSTLSAFLAAIDARLGTVLSGGGSANLSIGTKTATTLQIANSNGTAVTIPAATTTEAGLLTSADKLIISSFTGGSGTSGGDAQAGLRYNYVTTTTFPAASGQIILNNSTISSVNTLNIHEIDRNGSSLAVVLDTLVVDTVIQVVQEDNEEIYAWFKVSTLPTDNGTNRSIPVTYLSGSGIFTAGEVSLGIIQRPGGLGTTNLAIANRSSTTIDITSSTGTSATLPAATSTQAGLMTAALFNAIGSGSSPSGGIASITPVIEDNFVAANGTALIGKAATTGGIWTRSVSGTNTTGQLTIENNKLTNNNASYGDAFLPLTLPEYDIELKFGKKAAMNVAESLYIYIKTTAVGFSPYNYISVYSTADNALAAEVKSNTTVVSSIPATTVGTFLNTNNILTIKVRYSTVFISINGVVLGVLSIPTDNRILTTAGYFGLYMAPNSNALYETLRVTPAANAAADLSIIDKTSTTLTIASSIGTDAIIPAATTTEAGLMSAADKVALLNGGGGGSANAATPPIVQVIGNGTDTSFIINHTFNTRNVGVVVQETNTPYSEVLVAVDKTSPTSVTIAFDPAIVPTQDQYTVIVFALAGSSTNTGSLGVGSKPLASGTINATVINSIITITSTAPASGGVAPITYTWYSGSSSGFAINSGSLISNATDAGYTDSRLSQLTTKYYRRLATDGLGNKTATDEVMASTSAIPSRQKLTPIMTSNTTPSPFVASSSSNYSGLYPYKAFDGIVDDTPWASSFSNSNVEFLQIDLGANHLVDRVILAARTGLLSYPQTPGNFDIRVSTDGNDFTTVLSKINEVFNPGESKVYDFTAIVARYVRIEVSATQIVGANYKSIAEMEVWGY